MADPQAGPSTGERLGAQLEAVVMKRLQDDKLILPPMPTVAVKCLEIIQKSDFNMGKIADLLETDPILAARLMRTVNSAGMATKAPATNLQNAVMRLGQKNLRTVLLEASVGSVFESRDKRISDAAKAVWQHSDAVALLESDIGILLG